MSLNNSYIGSDNEEEEDDGNIEFLHAPQGREGIVFLIDCRKDMFRKDIKKYLEEDEPSENDEDNKYSAFVFALQCCKELMLNKIRLSHNSLISVVFFGIEKGDSNRKHIAVFQPLTVSNSAKIKQLDEIITSDTHDDFVSKYGHSDSENSFLTEGLTASLFSFSTSSVKLGSKRVLLFTKDDNPDSSRPEKQHQIRKRAQDLLEAAIELDLLPFGSEFNPKLFYQEIMDMMKKATYEIPVPFDNIYDAMDIINKESYNKRTLSRIKFHLGGEIAIGVGIYRFTRRMARLVRKTSLFRETNEKVRSVTEVLDMATGDKLRPYQVVKTTSVGGKDVSFTSDELSQMRKVFAPDMTLLGFKSYNFWKVEYHCCQPFFIFPDESIVKGSRQLFVALWKRCMARNVIAVCCLTARRGSRPRYVVLVPQEEILNEKRHQEMPAGFHVYVLPFGRMFGEMPVSEQCVKKPNENQMIVTRKLVKKLKIKKYHQDFFDNPYVSKLWAGLEAVALQCPDTRPFEDSTLVHHEKLRDRLADLAEEFNEMLLEELSTGSTKRKSSSSSAVGGEKFLKRAEFMDLALQKKIDKLTVAQLKDVLKLVPEVRVTGARKHDLTELIYKNIDSIMKNFS